MTKWLVALAAAVTAGTLVGLLAPAHAAVPPAAVQRYGIVRVDTHGTWTILSNAAHQPSGLTGVACVSGHLVVTFAPLATIGTFVVDEDESYAGRVDAGASVGLDRFVITFRRPSTGAVVACGDPALRVANSNVQLLVVGTAPA